MSPQRKIVTSLSLLVACAATLLGARAEAVGTRRFVLDSLSTLEGGDLSGVAISSNGEVRAGWTLAATPIADASSVWSAVTLPNGAVLLGTATGGRIYQVAGGKVSIAADTGEMGVSALAVAFDGTVIAGTFPSGKLFRIPPGALDGSSKKAWLTLEGAEDVWALAYDAKAKAVYAATGPEGKLFRVTAAGTPEIYFDSDEAHLVSVAVSPAGKVYTGSNGKALLYALSGPGRARVVRDFEGDDVKAIAFAPASKGGAMYAISNKYSGSLKGLRPPTATPGSASPQTPKPAKAGKGKLMRFDAQGRAELMMKRDDTHFVSLAVGDDGAAYVGTGAEGKVYVVDHNHVVRLMADTDERQVGALAVGGKARFVATTDPVVFHAITGSGGVEAVWTSKVLDAGMRAHFGRLEWRADGALELQTRSGNTDKPDKSWSDWSPAVRRAGKVASKPARYLQIRARWAADPAAVLREVRASFVTDNARALVTEISAGDDESNAGSSKVPASGAPPSKPSTKLALKWKVDNPDSDKLRYRLFYRPLGTKRWSSVLPSDEELTKTSYSWETTGLPEGRYVVRVDASDELSNPPSRVTRHSLISRSLLVDNTPPLLRKLALRGGKLSGVARDGLGPIARIEFALFGSKSWVPIFPADAVFDEPAERFAVDVSRYVPSGPQLVVVRAYDSAGNVVTATVAQR